jgi:uroporphyrinogen-III synthase
MISSLTGCSIALAEGRQLEELAKMLEAEGATILRYPMLSIHDAPDETPVLAWLRELIENRFDYVILMTGEGLRRLLGFADRAGIRAEVIAAFGRTRLIARGPKPVKEIKEIGLTPFKIATAPTTDGVIATLRILPIHGQTIGAQFFVETNPPLADFIAAAGATMVSVLPYVYAPASDSERIGELIGRLGRGEVSVLVFTSSPQIDRLYEVAGEQNRLDELARGLQQTRVAAVGPIVAETLQKRGAPVAICPKQGFVMKNLVKLIKDSWTGNDDGVPA